MKKEEINKLAHCKCGINILSEETRVKSKYSLFGWFLWSQGSTVVPKKMIFICTKCNQTFYETRDKEIIKHYMELHPY